MTCDITGYLFDPRQAYTSVRLQQGRVLTDLDWNERERIAADERLRLLADLICGGGSTNDGFRLLGAEPATARVPTGDDSLTNRATYDVRLGGGTFLLGGHLHSWPGLLADGTAPQSFLQQDDWLQLTGTDAAELPTVPEAPRTDLVYLSAFEHSVRAVEDRELRERALGGPDTSTRLKAMRRVVVLPNAGDGCFEAAATLRDHVTQPADGDTSGVSHAFVAELGEVRSKARLTVGFTGDAPTLDPCRPRTTQGYLGAENQAIRVQLVAGNRFLWAYDNAEPLYRVEISDAAPGPDGSIELRFLTTPRDPVLFPLQGAVAEILAWGALLANGEKVADLSGPLARVSASYNPATATLRIVPAVPLAMQEWLNAPERDPILNQLTPDDPLRYFYLRLWQPGPEGVVDTSYPFVPGGSTALAGTGLSVSFSAFGLPGDYWVIAARPNTPDRVVPWRLLDEAAPFGPRRFYAPLGLVRWRRDVEQSVATVEDCRHRFRKLCQIETCCTVHVGDGSVSHGEVDDLQAAIELLPPDGGRICLLPGTHRAAARLLGRRNVVIAGCGPRSRIVPAEGQTAPVIDIERCSDITLTDFAIAAADVVPVEARIVTGITFERLDLAARNRAALIATACRRASLLDSRVIQAALTEPTIGTNRPQEPAVFLAGQELYVLRNRISAPTASRARLSAIGGLQIGGDSRDVEIAHNEIAGGLSSGIVLGSVSFHSGVILRDAVQLRSYYAARLARPDFGARFLLGDNDCVTIDPRPRPQPNPNDPTPLDPVSDGPVEDCRIIRNQITEMGACGITVAYWFVPEEGDSIVTDRLLIEGNLIRNCMRLPVGAIPVELVEIAGFGGVALAIGADITIRDNEIMQIGENRNAPIVGIYILDGEAVTIQRNRLRDNGLVATQQSVTPVGRHGAIVFGTVRPGVDFVTPFGERPSLRQDGAPALIVEDNVAVAREGRALSVVGLGPMVVHGNQFTAHGSNSLARPPIGTAPANGVAISGVANNGLAARTATPNPLSALLNALGGAAVAILNLGVSNEVYLQLLGLSGLGQIDPEQAGRQALGDDLRLLANGNVQFNDNQIMLDNLAPAVTLALSSILILSTDDVAMQDNQSDCDKFLDLVLIDALVLGFSVRMQGNRLKESFGTTFLSALTIGLFNDTSHNQGTHCFFHFGLLQPRILLTGFGTGATASLDTNRHLAPASRCERFQSQTGAVATGVGAKTDLGNG
ncbi:DUF6519 domain-containing protein [Sphingomonas sp. BIUV-7]|uniref:DUF6519 domain-containing protein n=1 Tax=Sphingomonas natans TaxID=3063330 RepID=A0ABT8YCS8_9SPHN|nr:DUF6519 domain-containing protein [Sphingomonas sp. BIUV-7]MDO6416126.1 DUF6519 domain-containing protein [Sphingomonas sp. BIUV-7]